MHHTNRGGRKPPFHHTTRKTSIMITIETREAKRGFNCTCCGERVRQCEKYLQVLDNDSPVRGERYSIHCRRLAEANNPTDGGDDDGEAGLRAREAYGAYAAEGCTGNYWADLDAGYIR